MTAGIVRRATSAFDSTDPFLIVARLSLVLLLINARHTTWLFVLAALVCGVAFLNGPILRSPRLWFGLAGVLGASQAVDWWLVDNHRFATTYWFAALGLSRLADDPQRVLRETARLLVGAIFVLAFVWKVLSSQYLAGDMFRYLLVRDDRFEPVATLIGGADEEQLQRDRSLISEFTSTGDLGDAVEVAEGPRAEELAQGLTWGTLVVEGFLALAFLAPLRGRSRLLRPATLLVFCATTYAAAPVVGFGLLLTTLGYAQAETPLLRRTFLIASVAVFTWSVITIAVFL